jgi:hypothetical protein
VEEYGWAEVEYTVEFVERGRVFWKIALKPGESLSDLEVRARLLAELQKAGVIGDHTIMQMDNLKVNIPTVINIYPDDNGDADLTKPILRKKKNAITNIDP